MKPLFVAAAFLFLSGASMSAEPLDPSFRVLDWRLPAADKVWLSRFMGFRGINFDRRTRVWTITTKEGDEWHMRSPDEFLFAIMNKAAEYGYRCSLTLEPARMEWLAECAKGTVRFAGQHTFTSTALLNAVFMLPESHK
jgi:hypothetical protein